MKKNARWLSLFLAVLIAFGLAACQEGGAAPQHPTPPEPGPGRTSIRVGRVAPMTGALESFGKGSLLVEQKAVEELNAAGGIEVDGKKLPVEFFLEDSQSDPAQAALAAERLIAQADIDIMIVSHTAETVNPVSAVCEGAGIPCISVDAPVDAWLEGGPYTYSYHAFFDTQTELSCFADAWDLLPTNRIVGVMAANDAEGIEISEKIREFAPSRGYKVHDPGRYASGQEDYTEIITELKANNCGILMGVMLTPDFAEFWRQCRRQGYFPAMCTMAKAVLFLSDVRAIGEGGMGDGVITEVWWTPQHPYKSSLTGQTSAELGAFWEAEYGEVAPPSMGYKHANVELLVDILTRAASLDPQVILAAAAATDLDTCVGHVKFREDHACVMTLVAAQWWYVADKTYTRQIVTSKQVPGITVSPVRALTKK